MEGRRLHRASGLSKAEITLAKIERAKTEIFAKERDLKAAAMALLELFEFEAAAANRFHDDASRNRLARGVAERQQKVIELLKITSKERDEFRKVVGYEVPSVF